MTNPGAEKLQKLIARAGEEFRAANDYSGMAMPVLTLRNGARLPAPAIRIGDTPDEFHVGQGSRTYAVRFDDVVAASMWTSAASAA